MKVTKVTTVQKWIAIAVAEVLISLCLLAIAPIFLNSNTPSLGFAIWFAVPLLWIGSGGYVGWRIIDARRARTLFVTKFPEYSALTLKDFLELPASEVAQKLEIFQVAKEDPDFQNLQISPLDLLRSARKP